MAHECKLHGVELSKPAIQMTAEEYQRELNSRFMECGEDCDCCFFEKYGGLGFGSEEE